MTLGKSEFWAEFWRDRKEDYANIEKAVLIDRIIKGFKSKEHEKGFREGLGAVGEILSLCEAEEKLRTKSNKGKTVAELKKSLTKKT